MHWNRLIVVSALFLFPDCVLTASGTETSPTNAILDQSSDVFALIHPERVKARVTACVCPPAADDEIPQTALANFERFDPLEMSGRFIYFTHRFPGMDIPVYICRMRDPGLRLVGVVSSRQDDRRNEPRGRRHASLGRRKRGRRL